MSQWKRASLAFVSVWCCVDIDPEPFFLHSGASTASWRRAENGDASAEHWVNARFQAVEEQARRCWSVGGRYWETELDTPSYVSTLRVSGSTHDADCPGCLDRFMGLWSGVPDRLLGGLCAHATCDRAKVQAQVYPVYLARALHLKFALPSTAEHLKVQELSHWSQLHLDFVIGGLSSCGTNTITNALDQVNDVDFTMHVEDDFFYKHDSLLPYRDEVESFNFQWLSHSCSECLRGLRHPGLYHSHRVRLALTHIPRLKVVIIVCDPVSRFEKWFWMHLHCKAHAVMPRHKLADGRERCFRGPVSALEEPEMVRQASFGFHIRSLYGLLGSRLRMIHQAHLRHQPVETYTDVAHFLGARKLPATFKIERHNHQRGYRTDLCQNESLVRDLQQLFLDEYDAMEALLSSVGGLPLPEELLLRQTRCDRPEELEGVAPETRPAPLLVAEKVRSLTELRLRNGRLFDLAIYALVSTVVFNAVVLVGNKWTADALREIGHSTRGWSNVGTGIASALQTEIDHKMNNVSSLLLGSLEHVVDAQSQLDIVLSMVGNETDAAISKHPELSLLQQHGPERGLVLLQELHQKNASHVEALVPIIIGAIHQVMDFVMEEVERGLHTLLEKIKPALEQVGKWILQFGDKVTKGLEDFSSTLDKAQKMFDQVMAQLNGGGNNSDLMIQQTWPIFDDDDSGEVSATELTNVGNWFSISALQGKKAAALIKKYDVSGDGEIGPREFEKLVNDPSIPGSLSVILRKYAKRLAEIAGDVGEARLRDDVARSVANYVKLVCAKNMTKVDWISDRLGNGSVPLDFTGTVFVEMCLSSKDPNAAVFTSADTGLLLTTEVYKLHPEAMLSTIDLLGNSSWWQSQGYDLKDQPECIKMATSWITQVQKTAMTQGGSSLLSLLDGSTRSTLDSTLEQELELLEAMPQAAFIMAEESARLYRLERLQARQRRRNELFSSQTSQLLLKRLLGGVSASDVGNQDKARSAAQGGVVAVPETLEFAAFLRSNASARAKELQHYSFDYASESSNSIDDFASKIQAMIKKVESFIQLMEKYATPKGINDLEAKVEDFLTKAVEDVRKTVESKLVGLINKSAPQLESAIHSAAHNAGQRLGTMIGDVISTPLAQSLEKPLEEILAEAVGSNTTAAKIGQYMSDALGGEISNLTASALGDQIGDALEGLLDKALDKASDVAGEGLDTLKDKLKRKLTSKVSLLSVDSEIDRLFSQPKQVMLYQETIQEEGVTDTISHAWQGMVNLLRTFSNLLPTAVDTLKDARSEVSKLSSNLDSIFSVFEEKGPHIFNTVADLWVTIWVIYFAFILPFCALTLYYGLWANGWFGGPKPIAQEAEPQGEQTLWGRLSLLCSKCCNCCSNFHDTELCFWSIIIFMQVIVLVTFLIAVVMAIFAGVKAMIVAGCGQVYVLEDPDVCESALTTLRTFLTKLDVGHIL
ncbi:TY2B-C [Symbiodinium microadriaticum]|nr:TY2B-C [Symbiodinium microadriaticum]